MKIDTVRRVEGCLFAIGFAACIPAANWMIGHVGTVCIPEGPCLIPVGPFGLSAPSGVLMVGIALVLRDLVQRRLGTNWALAAIAMGTLLSAFFAPAALVIASATAFLLSEIADLAVYTPLQRRGLVIAVAASGAIGLIVDSATRRYWPGSSPCPPLAPRQMQPKTRGSRNSICSPAAGL